MNLENPEHPLYQALRTNDVDALHLLLQSNNLRMNKFLPNIFQAAAESGAGEGAVLVYERLSPFITFGPDKIKCIFNAALECNNGAFFRKFFDKFRLQIKSPDIQKFLEYGLKHGNADIVCETADHIYSAFFLTRFTHAMKTELGRHCVLEYFNQELSHYRSDRSTRFSLFLDEVLRKPNTAQSIVVLLSDTRHFNTRCEIFFNHLTEKNWSYLDAVAAVVDPQALIEAVQTYQAKYSNPQSCYLETWLTQQCKERILNHIDSSKPALAKRKM